MREHVLPGALMSSRSENTPLFSTARMSNNKRQNKAKQKKKIKKQDMPNSIKASLSLKEGQRHLC